MLARSRHTTIPTDSRTTARHPARFPRFFTPDFFTRFDAGNRSLRDLERVFARYAAHVRRLLPALAPSARLLARAAFHDCQLDDIHFHADRIRLTLRGTRYTRRRNNTWITRRGTHTVEFRGVTSATLSFTHAGRYVNHEELHRRGGLLNYHVLLDDLSTFSVTFVSVRVYSET